MPRFAFRAAIPAAGHGELIRTLEVVAHSIVRGPVTGQEVCEERVFGLRRPNRGRAGASTASKSAVLPAPNAATALLKACSSENRVFVLADSEAQVCSHSFSSFGGASQFSWVETLPHFRVLPEHGVPRVAIWTSQVQHGVVLERFPRTRERRAPCIRETIKFP